MTNKYLKRALLIFLMIVNLLGLYVVAKFFIVFVVLGLFMQIEAIYYGLFCIAYPVLLVKTIISLVKWKNTYKRQLVLLIRPLLLLILFVIPDYIREKINQRDVIKQYYTPLNSDYICNEHYFIRYNGYVAYRGPSDFKEWRYIRNYKIHQLYTFHWYDELPGEVTYVAGYDELKKQLVKDKVNIKKCRGGLPEENMPVAEDYVCTPEVFIIYQMTLEGDPVFSETDDFYEVHIHKPKEKQQITVYKTFPDLLSSLYKMGIDIKKCTNKKNQSLSKR